MKYKCNNTGLYNKKALNKMHPQNPKATTVGLQYPWEIFSLIIHGWDYLFPDNPWVGIIQEALGALDQLPNATRNIFWLCVVEISPSLVG